MYNYVIKSINNNFVILSNKSKINNDNFNSMYENTKYFLKQKLNSITIEDIANYMCDKYDFTIITPIESITHIPNLKYNESEDD